MLINAKRVEEIFMDCLIKDSDHIDCERLPEEDVVISSGVMNRYAFHKKRLESYREEIQTLINNLTSELNQGVSFLSLCADKNNNQWGQHIDCENLLCLGLGLNILTYPLPESMWGFLPGGVPMVILNE